MSRLVAHERPVDQEGAALVPVHFDQPLVGDAEVVGDLVDHDVLDLPREPYGIVPATRSIGRR